MINLPHTKKFEVGLYEIFVRLPSEYYTNEKKYPIIPILDPNFLFSALYGITRITENNIIVGIGHKGLDFSDAAGNDISYRSNLYRVRDFLPFKLDPNIFIPGTDDSLKEEILEACGKANDFALLIKARVLPLIENTFRVTGERTIVGHSFGGVFTLFMLLEYPQVFEKYIAISPVLDPRYYIEKEMFTSTASNGNNVYCAFGSLESDEREPDALGIAIRNTKKIIPNVDVIDGEDHVSVAISGMLRGLKFFQNY